MTAIVGIDVAKESLAVALWREGSRWSVLSFPTRARGSASCSVF